MSKVYLIKPTGVSYYGYNYPEGEKPQLTTYIAYTKNGAKKIETKLRTRGYRGVNIEEVRFESLRCIPLMFRQKIL